MLIREAAVIGAGPAGLAAAWALTRAGAGVTLYEARARVGGRLRTERQDGQRLDSAVQLLGSHYTRTLRLLDETGAARFIVRAPGRDALWRKGRAHTIVLGSASSLIASGAFPTGLKLRLTTRYLPFLVRHRAHLDANRPVLATAWDDVSITEWSRDHVGDDFADLIARPVLAAYQGAEPEETSAGWFHALASAALDAHVHAAAGGMGALAAAIEASLRAAGAEVFLGTAVTSLRTRAAGVVVETSAGARTHEAVVIATPAARVAELLEVSDPLAEWLAGVRTRQALSVGLTLTAQMQATYFGLTYPQSEHASVAAICFQRNKGATLTTPGREAVVVYPAPQKAAELTDADLASLAELARREVEAVVPGAFGHVSSARVYRHDPYVLLPPGALRHLERFQAAWLPPRVALAGDYLVAPSVEGAVRSGEAAALRLLRAAPAATG